MIVGLTGGIGSGKSAAACVFKNEGINVIDADNLAKEVVAKDTPGFIKVVEYFGSEIIAEDLDRLVLPNNWVMNYSQENLNYKV